MEEIIEKAKHFFEVAKEMNFDVVALYAKEPQMMQILGGVVVALVLILLLVIKSKMKHAGANKALQNLDSYLESFEEYQKNLQKILKTIKGAKGEFLESLQLKKEDHYKEQLATFKEAPLEEKLDKYTEMALLYSELAKAARDEELAEFYAQKAQEIHEKLVLSDISEYMRTFNFTPEDVTVLEKIVAYANAQEDPERVLSIVMEKLQSVDYGSNLERYTFVQNLDPQKLGIIYDYIKEQQEKLFEDGERVVASEVLEYLLENGEQEKVIAYVKSLKVPTHLQELYYRFFNQKDLEALDFAFISNPIEITQNYAEYLESLITDGWRDAKRLAELLEQESLTRIIGHDRVRQVIERVDALEKDADEENRVEEALELAKEAHRLALETKTLLELKEKKSEPQEETPQQEAVK